MAPRTFYPSTLTLTCPCCEQGFTITLAEACQQSWRARFWASVGRTGEDDCWPWTKWLTPAGYGRVHNPITRRNAFAHRLAWEFTRSPIPDGLFVHHLCEDRYPPSDKTYHRCCNPAHLCLVTNEVLVREIGDTVARGEVTQTEWAKRLGVTATTINKAVRGRSWKHVKP